MALTCRKASYPDRAAAQKALVAKRESGVLSAYRCPYCLAWHLTSLNRRGRRP